MLKIVVKRISVSLILLLLVYVCANLLNADFFKIVNYLGIASVIAAFLSSSNRFIEDKSVNLPSGYEDFYQEDDYKEGIQPDVEPTMYIIFNYSIPIYALIAFRILME